MSEQPRQRLRALTVDTTDGKRHTLWLADGERLCKVCKGRGHWESCFDCGNRGWVPGMKDGG